MQAAQQTRAGAQNQAATQQTMQFRDLQMLNLAGSMAQEEINRKKEQAAQRATFLGRLAKSIKPDDKESLTQATNVMRKLDLDGSLGFTQLADVIEKEYPNGAPREDLKTFIQMTEEQKNVVVPQGSTLYNPVTKQAEFTAPSTKAPNLKAMQNESGEYTYHQYNSDTGDWKDTGRKAQGRADEFGEPHVDSSGNLLQKNLQTGKLHKITSPPTGWTIESDGKGGFSMVQGPAKDMTVKTRGDVEEKLLGGREQLVRMQAIQKEFKPEYQKIGERLSREWTGIKAKLGKNVSPGDASKLTEFKTFQRKATENINLYIKELTGAQMSEKEADRLRLAQPDPGEHWYSGDDPITFKSKMDDIAKTTRAAVARYEYYRNKGLSDGEIKGLINSGSATSLESISSKMK